MAATIFNWALHAWAIYAVVGLGFAIFTYNYQMPMSLRSVFYPLLGNAVWGLAGDVIDILAVLATLFGLVASLGMGAEQTMAGISYVYGIPGTATGKILLIGVMTVLTFISVWGGIEKGIRHMSEANMILGGLLLAFVFAFGPTLLLLRAIPADSLQYLLRLPALPIRSAVPISTSTTTGPFTTGHGGSAGRHLSAHSWPGYPAAER